MGTALPSSGVNGSETSAEGAHSKARTVGCAIYDAALERVSKERAREQTAREGRASTKDPLLLIEETVGWPALLPRGHQTAPPPTVGTVRH